nr:hypothetical protein [Wolbachia endosymbiont of Oedothorax gibbosus]
MHYLKQILHQTEQTFLREVITDYHLADDIYEICTRHGNDIFLVADENTAKLLNKNVFNKISHLIIPAPPVIPARNTGIHKLFSWIPVSATWMTPSRKMTLASLETVNLVRNKAKDSDLIVAFGSGLELLTISANMQATSRKKIIYRSQQPLP